MTYRKRVNGRKVWIGKGAKHPDRAGMLTLRTTKEERDKARAERKDKPLSRKPFSG